MGFSHFWLRTGSNGENSNLGTGSHGILSGLRKQSAASGNADHTAAFASIIALIVTSALPSKRLFPNISVFFFVRAAFPSLMAAWF